MRLTSILQRQHIGRMINKLWSSRRTRKILNGDIRVSSPIYDVKEILKDDVHEEGDINMENEAERFDQHHPLYKTRPCFLYDSNTLLLEGLDQAKVITNTVEIENGFPSTFEEKTLKLPNEDQLVENCILSSYVFDAEQKKLPRVSDPDRPAFKFPRVYGITDKRRNKLMCEKLVHLCNNNICKALPSLVMNNGFCKVTLEKGKSLIQCSVKLDMFLISAKKLEPNASRTQVDETKAILLPDIWPLKPTVVLKTTHFYEDLDVPVFSTTNSHLIDKIHTVLIHYNETEMSHLHETAVRENHIIGRALMQSFIVAMAEARRTYGSNVKELPSPIVIHCIQTDGRLFDFVIFQLNTVNLSGKDGPKNIAWIKPRLELFKSAGYVSGKPNLEGYDPSVFRTFMAMCQN